MKESSTRFQAFVEIWVTVYTFWMGIFDMKKTITFAISCLFAAAFCAAQTQTSGSGFRQEGIASWYGAEFEGRPTASGEFFDPNQFTAAHLDLPFGTMLIVTNVVNGEKVVVRVNDRGPYTKSRIIDVSRAAAEKLNIMETGTAQVIIELAPRNVVAEVPSGVSNTVAERTSGAAATAEPAGNSTGAATASAAKQEPPQSAPETQANPDVVQETAALEPNTQASSTGSQAAVTLPANMAAPSYTPQQPALAQTSSTPVTQPAVRSPTQTSAARTASPGTSAAQSSSGRAPAQTPVTQPRLATSPQTLPAAPASSSRTQSGSAPIASFQPIPTVTRPPASTTGTAPVMPGSAMVPSIPPVSTPAPAQQTRNQPVYASAEIAGGPFVSGRYYRLQVGSYKVSRNAVEVFDRLSAAGLNPQWEPYGDLYRVVISNVRAEDINTIAVRLGNAGFKEAIAREER